ncbi:alginate lyase family protein [Rhodococcus sp. NPDC059234]|uniref:heparinase II/III family protein n=1 Tax=Rhodococcus sp. NPDC059234 TaxID=3346781 RepID=UPI00366D5B55
MDHPAAAQAVVAAARQILAGDVTYLGYPAAHVGRTVDWNHDPIADFHWPLIAARRIDHRTAASDPKWIWELNRLQHLPWLAQAWLFTNDDRFAEAAFVHLDSWIDQNPVGTGIAWRGAFESGVRAISVATALQGLRDSPALSTARFRRVVGLLGASARYCWRGRSRFSSANNHLVGELAGLACVAMMLPELGSAEAMRQRAIRALAIEAGLQILPDGMGAEQSIGYHVFTAEALSLVAAWVTLRGDPVPREIADAIDRSANFLAALVDGDDPQPRYGDDDGSFALRLGPEPLRTVRDHLGVVAAVTGNSAARRVGRETISSAWLSDAIGKAAGAAGGRAVPASFYAPQGGLAVLRSGNRRLTMDIGPLGYLAIAAHGHADALAVTLTAGGRELIGDPGTCSYYGDPDRHSVHRGTRAHATVCVDEADQSVIGGQFLWTDHARVNVHSVDLDRGIVDAEHDGYRRLDDPVAHRRWLIAPPGGATVVVVDLVSGSAPHDVRVSWPLHPSLQVTASKVGHLVRRDDAPVLQLAYAATAPLDVEQVRANSDSNLGWWSDRLESRTPSWLVGVHCHAGTPLAVLTVLRLLDRPGGLEVRDQEIELRGAALVASWSERGRRHGFTVDCTGRAAVDLAGIGW